MSGLPVWADVCPDGTVQTKDNPKVPDDCRNCLRDQYETDHKNCLDCPKGKTVSPGTVNNNQGACDSCKQGFYASGVWDQAGECTPCPDGSTTNQDTKWADIQGAAKCSVQIASCKKNFFFNTATKQCTQCGTGKTTQGEGKNTECDLCLKGFWAERVGNEEKCTACLAGKTTPGEKKWDQLFGNGIVGETQDLQCSEVEVAPVARVFHPSWHRQHAATHTVHAAASQLAQVTAAPQAAPMESMPSGVNRANSLQATRVGQGLLGGYALPLKKSAKAVKDFHIVPLTGFMMVTLLGGIFAITKFSRRRAVTPEEHSAEESLVPTVTGESNQVE